MAKTRGYASLFLLLIMVAMAQYGLGIRVDDIQIGSIHIFNSANNVPDDMFIQNTIRFKDGTSRTDPAEPLGENTSYQLQVVDSMTCIHTSYVFPSFSLFCAC